MQTTVPPPSYRPAHPLTRRDQRALADVATSLYSPAGATIMVEYVGGVVSVAVGDGTYLTEAQVEAMVCEIRVCAVSQAVGRHRGDCPGCSARLGGRAT